MAMRTGDISVSAIKGLRDALTSLGLVTTEYLYNASTPNWIFKSPIHDKVIQFKQNDPASQYWSNWPFIYVGDAYDGSTGVTNANALNSVIYSGTTYNKITNPIIVANSSLCHIHAVSAGTTPYIHTFTFGRLADGKSFGFVTQDAQTSPANGATGMNSANVVTRPFTWNLDAWTSENGNYFVMDFLIGNGNRASGKVANAQLIASPLNKVAGPQVIGNDVIAPLSEMEANSIKINSNMLIKNGAI